MATWHIHSPLGHCYSTRGLYESSRVEGESTILLGKVWRMRKSETMRAASRLLLSHPIVCLLAVVAAVVVLGVLGPLKEGRAADEAAPPVQAETFDVQPTGTSVVTNTTLYAPPNGQALKFSNNTAIAEKPVTFTSSGDVVLMARAGQSGG